MSIFSSILDKLGINKPAAPAATTPPPASAGSGEISPNIPHPVPSAPYTPISSPKPPAVPVASPSIMPTMPTPPAAPVEMPMVDVVSHLDYLAKTGPIQGLNWRMSINDLMALLGLPHTPQDIKDLAVELGCPEKEMGDSYSRNVWTHQALLKKIAENGGNIPQDLLK
jgi:hypothetical protein